LKLGFDRGQGPLLKERILTSNRLTEHFTLAEFVESDTATRLGIDNSVPPFFLENLKRTAEMGEVIRSILGGVAGKEIAITVTSGYRCEALEKVLCVKDYGQWCARRNLELNDDSWKKYFSHKAHPQGRAMDFKVTGFGNPFHIVRELQKHADLMAIIDQLIQEGVTVAGDGWVHAGWSETPRHEIRTAIFDSNGVPFYSFGLT